MRVGWIVARKDGNHLRSGASAYEDAVVVQSDPLVLVSRETDMRWKSTVRDVEFVRIGAASKEQLERCMCRL